MSENLEQQLERALHELARARAELGAIERSKYKRNLEVARIYARSCEQTCDRLRGLIAAQDGRNNRD